MAGEGWKCQGCGSWGITRTMEWAVRDGRDHMDRCPAPHTVLVFKADGEFYVRIESEPKA